MEGREEISPVLSRVEKNGKVSLRYTPGRHSSELHIFSEGGFIPKEVKRILKDYEKRKAHTDK